MNAVVEAVKSNMEPVTDSPKRRRDPIRKVQRLQKLKPLHYQMLMLHCEGKSVGDIAKITGKNYNYTSLVLNHPKIKVLRERLLQDKEMDLVALHGLAVDTVREAMEKTPNNKLSTRLRGVQAYIKLRESSQGGGSVKTAEDMVQEVMSSVGQLLKNSQLAPANKPDPRVIEHEPITPGSDDEEDLSAAAEA